MFCNHGNVFSVIISNIDNDTLLKANTIRAKVSVSSHKKFNFEYGLVRYE